GPSVPKILSTASTVQEKSDELSAWNEVAKMCRRICLLRATGQNAEAARAQSSDLPRALELTGSRAADPAVANRLSALFASAEERIADALVLAELLAPMLAQHLQPALATLRPAAVASASEFSAAT